MSTINSITEDIEDFPMPILSFAIAMRLWMSKNPKKEIEKRFKLNKSQNHNFGINYRKGRNNYGTENTRRVENRA